VNETMGAMVRPPTVSRVLAGMVLICMFISCPLAADGAQSKIPLSSMRCLRGVWVSITDSAESGGK
jgi:hypothetical protein